MTLTLEEINKLKIGEKISVLVDRHIIDYIGPTNYITYVGTVAKFDYKKLGNEKKERSQVRLENVIKYMQPVWKEKYMPYVARRYLGKPEKIKSFKSEWLILEECVAYNKGEFFSWMGEEPR